MGDEQASAQPFEHFGCQLGKARCRRHHRRIDPGQAGDETRNRAIRIDQRAPFARAILIDFDEADFDNAVGCKVGA